MEPSNHTRLMNYIIGMCKKHKDWISIFNDLGYELELIEQQIRTSPGDIVKPDVITTSNRLLHSLIIECKGGVTVDAEQLGRYSKLTRDDLRRWVTVFSPGDLKFDICLSDLEESHSAVAAINKEFPMITFAADRIFKTGDFKQATLNEAFREAISLQGKNPPLSYYPFCEEDKDDYVALFVLRGLVSTAVKHAKGGPSSSEEIIVTRDDLVKSIFNPVLDALSRDHQTRLKEKIKEILHLIIAREEMKEILESVEEARGVKIAKPLERFAKEATKFIEELETRRSLMEFV